MPTLPRPSRRRRMRSGEDAPHPEDCGQWGAGDTSEGHTDQMPDYSKYTAELRAEREWRRLNRELWEQEVEAWAIAEAAAGRKFSMAEAVQRIRWRDRVDGRGDDVRVNDHWAPIWSRILVAKHPQVKPYIVQKRTPWDDPRIKEQIV